MIAVKNEKQNKDKVNKLYKINKFIKKGGCISV